MDIHEKALAEAIHSELRREIENLREELGQIRDLVQDAIIKLQNSFGGLRDQSNAQHSLVSSLIFSMEGNRKKDASSKVPASINIRNFVEETDLILRSFVDHIILVSRQSMEMVHQIDDLADQMTLVTDLVKDVRKVADQTNVLSLNARIVAARAGEAGRAFNVVADEVRKLSKDSRGASDRISTVVDKSQNSIGKAKKIVETMASKDMSFAIQSKGRVDEMMQEISEIDRFTARTLSEVSVMADSINHNVGLAVLSLQFEDMITQISQNMERKFDTMLQFSGQLCCGCPDAVGGGQVDRQARLHHVRQALEGLQQQFNEADRKAVRQTSMDEGDVELF